MSFQDPNMMWDFFSLRPETTHQVMILFGDRGIPDGFRHMDGFGSHTFKLVNKDGNAVYCKFHIKVRFNFFVIFRGKFFFSLISVPWKYFSVFSIRLSCFILLKSNRKLQKNN